jgi:hypothetical protein
VFLDSIDGIGSSRFRIHSPTDIISEFANSYSTYLAEAKQDNTFPAPGFQTFYVLYLSLEFEFTNYLT